MLTRLSLRTGAVIKGLGAFGLAVLLESAFTPAKADDAAALAEQMLSTLKVDQAKQERSGEFDDVVIALKRAGYIHKRYDAKEDYSEIWKMLKPLDLYGNRVLVVSNEREGKYIGCCMENRTQILVAVVGNIVELQGFAKNNGCHLDADREGDQDSLKEKLKKLRIKPDAAKFAELNCTANLSQK